MLNTEVRGWSAYKTTSSLSSDLHFDILQEALHNVTYIMLYILSTQSMSLVKLYLPSLYFTFDPALTVTVKFIFFTLGNPMSTNPMLFGLPRHFHLLLCDCLVLLLFVFCGKKRNKCKDKDKDFGLKNVHVFQYLGICLDDLIAKFDAEGLGCDPDCPVPCR